ncbi:MAG: adenosylcobinamide-GDP ribazoletransferase [Proteobacteria bacterium]|nr:adenosylcobinamide-GDP ribazoletransferase [Pseudomonadota bacterium]
MSRDPVSELRLAFSLLTRLPVGSLKGEVPAMAETGWAWPIVGAAVGAVMAAVCGAALWLGLPPVMAAFLALAAGALVTGGMHEDGLADVADGFGGGRDRARKLEIMRDSRVGSYGVIALVLAIGFRAAGIAEAAEAGAAPLALIALGAASRAGLPLALALMPPARSDGLGRAAGAAMAPALVALLLGAVALLGFGPGAALAVALTMALAGLVLAALAMRQIGGQSGDVLGAMQVVTECAGWAALAAVGF